MKKIEQVFSQLKKDNRTAFIPFVTVGDPDIPTTLEILHELQDAGANMIELGVPYSDPLADGPVIQRATERALEHHVTILDAIRVAKKSRESNIHLPLILFTYYNPLLQIGLDTAFSLMKDSDINGIIVPDLPVEESEKVRSCCEKYHIDYIPLIAPTSKDRIDFIVNKASGFIYCISSLGVTGKRNNFHHGIEEFISSVRQSTTLPVVVGFGISNADQYQRFSEVCDGVVVGSAIVHTIEENINLLGNNDSRSQGLKKINEFVIDMISFK